MVLKNCSCALWWNEEKHYISHHPKHPADGNWDKKRKRRWGGIAQKWASEMDQGSCDAL